MREPHAAHMARVRNSSGSFCTGPVMENVGCCRQPSRVKLDAMPEDRAMVYSPRCISSGKGQYRSRHFSMRTFVPTSCSSIATSSCLDSF